MGLSLQCLMITGTLNENNIFLIETTFFLLSAFSVFTLRKQDLTTITGLLCWCQIKNNQKREWNVFWLHVLQYKNPRNSCKQI